MEINSFETFFTQFRKVSLIAVIASGFGSLLMFLIGAVKVFRAYESYFLMELAAGDGTKAAINLSIAYLVQAIDAFLIALVFMIFGAGIFSLFMRTDSAKAQQATTLFEIRSITDLKRILAELIIIILMVKFLEEALVDMTHFRWEDLALAASILLLATAVRVLKLDR